MKGTKVYLWSFIFTFLQSECFNILKNNALIIFKKNGVGIRPCADSIRTLRPDFQVPFLSLTFLFKVQPLFWIFLVGNTGLWMTPTQGGIPHRFISARFQGISCTICVTFPSSVLVVNDSLIGSSCRIPKGPNMGPYGSEMYI